jgi:hypothetical protein
MAMYYCEGCDNLLDNDYHPMEEDELCPGCHLEKQSQKEERDYVVSQRHAHWCKQKGLT